LGGRRADDLQGFKRRYWRRRDGPDLESMFGGPLEDVTKVQVGETVREIRRR